MAQARKDPQVKQIIVCTPRRLPQELLVPAARTAVEINPLNHPPLHRLTRVLRDFKPTPERIAVVTTKYWGVGGVRLTVGFMDNRTDPQVRVAREGGERGGYWSYLGTDILHIPKNGQTMNLEEFSMSTP